MTLLTRVAQRCAQNNQVLLRARLGPMRQHISQQVGRSFQRGAAFEKGPLSVKHLFKPLVFTVSVCSVSVIGATIWRFEESQKKPSLKKLMEDARQHTRRQQLPPNDPLGMIRNWFQSQGDGFKVFLGLAALNTLVFLAWKMPHLQPAMMRYFVTSVEPNKIRLLPMILSNFSHNSPFHLGLNMMVLYSFSSLSVNVLGKENFLALYLGSGVASSLASYAYKVAVGGLAPSLGASGAILGVLASCCIERPDIQLMIIFLPFFSFSSATALKGILLFDALGCIMRFGFFDHAAHLGGTLFGVYYSTELKEMIQRRQHAIINRWLQLKKYL